MPKFGRDLGYFSPSAELLVVGSAPEVYRLNLQVPLPQRRVAQQALSTCPLHCTDLSSVGSGLGKGRRSVQRVQPGLKARCSRLRAPARRRAAL